MLTGCNFFRVRRKSVLALRSRDRAPNFFGWLSSTEPCGMDGVVQVPQYPILNCNGCPNCAPGTFDVAVTPDGLHAFVANEYGQLPSPTPATETGGGTIGVIKVERDASGGFTRGTKPVEPYNTICIPGGDTIPGITMSHDGRYLYVKCVKGPIQV